MSITKTDMDILLALADAYNAVEAMEERIAAMRANGHKAPADDEAQANLDLTLRMMEMDDLGGLEP